MDTYSELIPELATWNDGAGIPVEAWIVGIGRTDQAVGYAALFWPEFVSFEGYVFRAPVNVERLRGWEIGGRATRQQIETAMNMLFLEHVFPDDDAPEELFDARLNHLVVQMEEMLLAKLARQFPERTFSVFVIDDGDDFGISFHQS